MMNSPDTAISRIQVMQWLWRWRWLIAVLSGATIGFAYPPLPFGALAWVGFVPLLALIDVACVRRARWFDLLYVFGCAWHGAANWWVMSWQSETDPFLMVGGAVLWLVHPLFLIPALVLYGFIRRRGMKRSWALAVMVCGFVGIEWLHSLGDLSYPWLALGYTQLRMTALVQIADLTGVWGISCIVITLNAIVYAWVASALVTAELIEKPLHASWRLGGWMLVVLAVPLVYGVVRLAGLTSEIERPVRLALVQPNVNPWQKWSFADMNPLLDQHRRLQDSLRSRTQFDLSIWSETALPLNLLDASGAELLTQLRAWCDSTGAAILTGFAYIERYQPLRAYNAAILIRPGSDNYPVYRKSRLTPFGEYMPFSDIVPELSKALQWGVGISSWVKGPGACILPLCTAYGDTLARLGVMICIESVYPNYCAEFVRRGADILVVITNDAWYDSTIGPDQHFAIAQMRAIETRRPIARCANSGITGFISPLGTIMLRASAQKQTAIAATLFPQHRTTVYVLWGDWLPIIALICATALYCLWRWYPTARNAPVPSPALNR